MSRKNDQYVREKLSSLIVPNHAERQTEGTVEARARPGSEAPASATVVESRTLLVTDFCKGGSVTQHAQRMHAEKKPFDGAINMGIQMSAAYMDIQKAQCFFPDSKSDNWLVDDNGLVRVADTKSFLFTNADGQFKDGHKGNRQGAFLSTPGYRPPEFQGRSMLAEPAHVALLGINLYCYLTHSGCGRPPEGEFNDGHFDHDIFKDEPGKKFKELIQKMVAPNPGERPSLAKVQEELGALKGLLIESRHQASASAQAKMKQGVRESRLLATSTNDTPDNEGPPKCIIN